MRPKDSVCFRVCASSASGANLAEFLLRLKGSVRARIGHHIGAGANSVDGDLYRQCILPCKNEHGTELGVEGVMDNLLAKAMLRVHEELDIPVERQKPDKRAEDERQPSTKSR